MYYYNNIYINIYIQLHGICKSRQSTTELIYLNMFALANSNKMLWYFISDLPSLINNINRVGV